MSGNGKRVMFGFLFPLFQQYLEQFLNLGQFLLLESRVFEKIHLEWTTFNGMKKS